MTPKKKIIIVRSNEIAPDARVERTATQLTEMGHEVLILAWDRTGALPRVRKTPFGTIRRIRIKASYGSGARLIPKLALFWVRIITILTKERFDAVHACDFDTAFPSLLIARLRDKRCVFDIFDMYSQGANIPSLLRPLLIGLEHLTMRMSHRIIVPHENRLPDIPHTLLPKTTVIYNTPPDTTHKTTAPGPVKKHTLRIIYAGQLNEGRYILEMASIVSKMPDAELIIAGFGSAQWHERLIKHIAPMSNVTWLGKLEYTEAIALEASADALFAFYDLHIPQNRKASSNKLFEAMMLSKPIIVNRGTSMEHIVGQYDCGYVINTLNQDEITSLLTSLISHPKEAAEKGVRGRRAYEQHFSSRIMAETLKRIYSSS